MFRNASVLTTTFLTQIRASIIDTYRRNVTVKNRREKRSGKNKASHKSLTFDLKSVPPFKKEHWRKKKKNSIHYSIHSHLTRVAWFPVHQVSLFTNHRVPTLVSFHRTRPENEPLLSYPCLSLEPDTCSSFPPSTRLANGMGEISPSSLRSRPSDPRIEEIDASGELHSLHSCCCSKRVRGER